MPDKVPLRVRLAIASDRRFKQTLNALRAAHLGLWLGLLDDDHLAVANAAAYDEWDRYLDEEYNRSGLTDWERDVVMEHFTPRSLVLVPSAGAAREVLGLADLGFVPTGFDPSPVLVDAGGRLIEDSQHEARLVLSRPDRVPPNLDGPFDAILFGWGGYIHVRGRDARVALLAELRSLVEPDAPMVLSFFLRSPGDRTFAVARTVAETLRRFRRCREPVEVGDTVAGTFDHYFTWDEIESEIAAGGFTLVERSTNPYPHVVCRAM